MALGMALAGASLASGAMGMDAASDAKSASRDAARAAAWLDAKQRNRLRRTLSPYVEAGDYGLEGLLDTLRGGEDTMEALRSDPRYQFQLEEGLNAVEGSAATRGNLRSGATLKALTEYGQGLASNALTQRQNLLGQLADRGAGYRQAIATSSPMVMNSLIGAQQAGGQAAMQRAQIGSDMIGGLMNAGMVGASGMSLRDLLGAS